MDQLPEYLQRDANSIPYREDSQMKRLTRLGSWRGLVAHPEESIVRHLWQSRVTSDTLDVVSAFLHARESNESIYRYAPVEWEHMHGMTQGAMVLKT
eukprot:2533198-Amphidinium_carterae.1